MSGAELVPSFFPSFTKECKPAAEQFFECFTKNGVKLVDEDVDTGRRGVAKCSKEMKVYSECMTAAEKTKPPKRLRVSRRLPF